MAQFLCACETGRHQHCCHEEEPIVKKIRGFMSPEGGPPQNFDREQCRLCGEWLGDTPVEVSPLEAHFELLYL